MYNKLILNINIICIVQQQNHLFTGTCDTSDISLGVFTTDAIMKENGWSFDLIHSRYDGANKRLLRNCAASHGYSPDHDVGRLTATFKGQGTATLIYANCEIQGEVKVFLNDREIDSTTTKGLKKTKVFSVKRGDTLKIEDHNHAIFQIYSLTIIC